MRSEKWIKSVYAYLHPSIPNFQENVGFCGFLNSDNSVGFQYITVVIHWIFQHDYFFLVGCRVQGRNLEVRPEELHVLYKTTEDSPRYRYGPGDWMCADFVQGRQFPDFILASVRPQTMLGLGLYRVRTLCLCDRPFPH